MVQLVDVAVGGTQDDHRRRDTARTGAGECEGGPVKSATGRLLRGKHVGDVLVAAAGSRVVMADDETVVEYGRLRSPDTSIVGSALPTASGPGCSHEAELVPVVQVQPSPTASISLKL